MGGTSVEAFKVTNRGWDVLGHIWSDECWHMRGQVINLPSQCCHPTLQKTECVLGEDTLKRCCQRVEEFDAECSVRGDLLKPFVNFYDRVVDIGLCWADPTYCFTSSPPSHDHLGALLSTWRLHRSVGTSFSTGKSKLAGAGNLRASVRPRKRERHDGALP